ncbi:cobalamin biosynthesis protein [Mesorhizobium sp.]|uniref:cobalamin biosynthesis protein n=1 Tax=Mesorhizobium sp. TaxID=1871066 RepID=UPI0025CBD7A7|nr:cobalamin biosynthesis protein [Mesorhizobium sp.]
MKVAGLGFRHKATLASLRDALIAAGDHHDIAAVATVDDRAGETAIGLLARELKVPIKAVAPDRLAGVSTLTQSAFVKARYGTGSVAEASALVAAGRNARLIATRAVSRDGKATAAIAEGEGE